MRFEIGLASPPSNSFWKGSLAFKGWWGVELKKIKVFKRSGRVTTYLGILAILMGMLDFC